MKPTILLLSALFFWIAACNNGEQTETTVEETEPEVEIAETPTAVEEDIDYGYQLLIDSSNVEWRGYKTFTHKEHYGTIAIIGGGVNIEDGNITGGKIVIDMKTIVNLDMKGTEYGTKLEGHLSSPDFFDVEQFPSASFKIIEMVVDTVIGDKSLVGNLTIKGITKEITVPIQYIVEGDEFRASATFTFNRIDWDIKFGSDSFFDLVKDEIIDNNIAISFSLVANKSKS